MQSKLLKGVEDDQINEVKAHYKEAINFRKRLTSILEDEVEALHRSMRDEELYKTPNWSLIQADRIAQVKALKRVILLLS